MVKKILASLIILFLAFNLVSAVDTEIKIKTLPNHKIYIFILDPAQTFNSLQSYHEDSGSEGYVSVKYSGSTNKIDVLVNVKKDNKMILSQKFEDYKTGEPIFIRIDNEKIDGEYIESQVGSLENANSTKDKNTANNSDSTEEIAENTKESNETLKSDNTATGKVVSNSSSSGSSWVFYIVLGVILITIVAVLLIWRFVPMNSMIPSHPKGIPFHTSYKPHEKPSPEVHSLNSDKNVLKLEKELEEAQREIRLLKNKERIKDAEDRIKNDKAELDRLRRGEI